MERDRMLGILREHEQELKAAGLLHLRLFGSVARGDNTPASDVDLLFDYNGRSYGFGDLLGWQNTLTTLLERKVDLIPADNLKASIKPCALLEAVRAF